MIQIESITDIVKAKVSAAFEKIVTDQLNEQEALAQQRIEKIFSEARKEAKHVANTMTLELLRKADLNGISVELKL